MVTKEGLHAALQDVVDSRRNLYASAYALHWRWADDNTSACEDEKRFRDFVELMNIPPPETYVIPEDPLFNKIPGFEVQQKIARILAKAAHDPGDSVVILHYAGHGRENVLGRLELCSLSGRVIAVDHLLRDVLSEYVIPFDERVDVVVILDCCFAFLASRTNEPNYRRVDILSGSEERNPTALGAKKTNSFTAKLLIEARLRAQNGDRIIEMSSLIDRLIQTSPVKKPAYAGKLGPGSIILPLVSTVQSVASRPSVPGLMATFSVHVSDNFTDSELRDLVRWVGNLPKSKSATLRLEGIKKTNSFLFVFQAPLNSFYRVMGCPDITLICENEDISFDHILHPPPPKGKIRTRWFGPSGPQPKCPR